jgi:adenine-specific DNA methylase
LHGQWLKSVYESDGDFFKKTIGMLSLNKCINWNAKLSKWGNSEIHEQGLDVFYNQALNTFYNYSTRALVQLQSSIFFRINHEEINANNVICVNDARHNTVISDFWITDPPYADAINYHELSEFFLSWDKALLKEIFPDWYTDSKRALAVAGKGESFNKSMVEIYSNLTKNMPDNGMQIVMFTHQDVSVWAELSMILWSAGLRVTAAWNIATETDAVGLKQGGNYVKGTVLLVLRKQTSEKTAYLYELYPEIEEEVSRQIEVMQKIDDKDEPNFSDPDYLLAAYAASLKVLTSYKKLEDIDVQYELSRSRKSGEESPVAGIIRNAVKIAYDMLIPAGFDKLTWKSLSREERFYIKGLDMERAGNYQVSALQELARGFGVVDYKDMLASTKANEARLKTAHEYAQKSTVDGFGVSVVREVLGAIYTAVQNESAAAGLTWLHSQVQGYWDNRRKITEILSFIMSFEHIDTMPQWGTDSKYARFINELVINDGV